MIFVWQWQFICERSVIRYGSKHAFAFWIAEIRIPSRIIERFIYDSSLASWTFARLYWYVGTKMLWSNNKGCTCEYGSWANSWRGNGAQSFARATRRPVAAGCMKSVSQWRWWDARSSKAPATEFNRVRTGTRSHREQQQHSFNIDLSSSLRRAKVGSSPNKAP